MECPQQSVTLKVVVLMKPSPTVIFQTVTGLFLFFSLSLSFSDLTFPDLECVLLILSVLLLLVSLQKLATRTCLTLPVKAPESWCLFQKMSENVNMQTELSFQSLPKILLTCKRKPQ